MIQTVKQNEQARQEYRLMSTFEMDARYKGIYENKRETAKILKQLGGLVAKNYASYRSYRIRNRKTVISPNLLCIHLNQKINHKICNKAGFPKGIPLWQCGKKRGL